MIFGKLSSFAVAALATTSVVVDARSCKARYHSKLPVQEVQSSPVPEPNVQSTTLATIVQPAPSNVSENLASSSETQAVAVTNTASASPSTGTSPATSPSETFFGVGTRYGLADGCTEKDCWQKGACSFVNYELPAGIDGTTCISDDIWDKGANCGGCISVTYKGTTLKIMVTNRTGGNATHLDMTPDTWSKLTHGYSGGGVDGIEWQWIECPLAKTEPLQVHMHSGASKYWFAATIENATLRTKQVEVSSDQGATWKPTTLKDPNMYILDGTLPDQTCWVRVTSIEGSQVIVKDVALSSGQVTKATENF